jgi:hypothetical protein
VAAAIALLPARALAVDFTMAGSGALDYRVFSPSGAAAQTPALVGIDSLVFELSHKVVVEVSERMSVSLKVCVGCHGFEVDQGYAELHLLDALNLRVGRFNVPIGEFNARHDPANYTAPSKPLPYAMGDMLYYGIDAFNLGIVPTPYSDDGLEVFGSTWIAERLLVDYTAYAVKGFAGQNDLDFAASRRFRDNNSSPAFGGRLVASAGPISIGGSAAAGTYDRADELWYYVFGGELYARWGRLVLRGEYIVRRTDIDRTATGYKFVIKEPYFLKTGYYGQLDWNLTEWLTLIYRVDGLRRSGIPLPGSLIDNDLAEILRNTGALALRPWGGFLVKGGYERWTFSGVPFPDQNVVRVGIVYSY